MKKLLLGFILLFIFPLVYAEGRVEVSPVRIEGGNYLDITIYPDSAGMDCVGIIKVSGTSGVAGSFRFECDSHCRCYNPAFTKFYVNKLMWGEYYASVWDNSIGDFSKGYFYVITDTCSNGIKNGNESDADCGGDRCSKCSDKKDCRDNSDCNSGYCDFKNKCGKENSVKKREKYSQKEAFLVSDENWKNVLKLVPLTIWNENSETVKYPALIYHREKEIFDSDSAVHFLQLYSPSHLTIFGESPEDLDRLLVADKTFGVGLKKEEISKVSFKDYYSYWGEIKEVVVSENNYETGLMASVFASYKNSPLVFEDEIEYGVLDRKVVYIIGDVDKKILDKIKKVANTEVYSLEDIQKEYIKLTNTDKLIAVNPNDLEIELNKNFRTKKSSKIKEVYGKNSLASPFLAAEKKELIINIKLPESPENSKCEINSIISDNFKKAKEDIEKQINNLFIKDPEYITIIASPNSIPDSVYRDCHETNSQFRSSSDSIYANINNKTLKIGRIYGVSVTDSSSYVARDIFYRELFDNIYGNNATGLSIGHSFDVYSDNMQKQYKASKESGYESVCYTGGAREGCIRKIKLPLSEYSKKQFIIFGDHGYPNEWVSTLKSNKIPYLDLSYVFAHACSTNNYWEGKEKLMGANIIRNGAIAYQGSAGISYFDNSESIALQKLTSNNITLGELNKELIEELKKYRRDYIMLGDPVLEPKFKKIEWSGIDFSSSDSNRSEAETKIKGSAEIVSANSEKDIYFPGEDIIIKLEVKNLDNNEAEFYLEHSIFSEEDIYISELIMEKINLSGNEEREFSFSMEVIDAMPSGKYKAIVRLVDNSEEELDKKEIFFEVNGTKKEMEIELKSCEDKDCENENKIFSKNETVYLGYESDSTYNINFYLKFPDGTAKEIPLPYEFSPDKDGIYTLIINASEEGYEDYEDEMDFAIADDLNIPIKETCNADKTCGENENIQNCPQDCNNADISEENQKNLQKVPDSTLKSEVCSELFFHSRFLCSSKRLHSSPFSKMESSGFDDNSEYNSRERNQHSRYIENSNGIDETELKGSEILNTKYIADSFDKKVYGNLEQINGKKLYKSDEKISFILWIIIIFMFIYIVIIISLIRITRR